jgi:hypothetical protein
MPILNIVSLIVLHDTVLLLVSNDGYSS